MSGLASSLGVAGFRGSVEAESRLAPHTTWRIGGPAEVLARPADLDDLRLALDWTTSTGIPWRILGNGSNLLVADRGVRGLVLHVRRALDAVSLSGNRLRAGAGASLPAVARLAAARGLAGLEFGTGIPGTLGGAVRMNAGWHEFEIGPLVHHVRVLDHAGREARLARDDCEFAYRHSRFRGGQDVIVEVELELASESPSQIRERLSGFAASRKAHQPTELPSCGSVFLKPPGDFAGRLIEACGLKGLRVGAVEVSSKHANFFVNHGGAAARDVLELVGRVEAEVARQTGVALVREFEYWS